MNSGEREDISDILKRAKTVLSATPAQEESKSSSLQPMWNRATRRRFNKAMKKARELKLMAHSKQWKLHFKNYGFSF